MKYHLAKISWHDVGLWPSSCLEVIRATHDAIYAKVKKREEAAANRAECAGKSSGLSTFELEGSGSGSTTSPTKRSSIFVP